METDSPNLENVSAKDRNRRRHAFNMGKLPIGEPRRKVGDKKEKESCCSRFVFILTITPSFTTEDLFAFSQLTTVLCGGEMPGQGKDTVKDLRMLRKKARKRYVGQLKFHKKWRESKYTFCSKIPLNKWNHLAPTLETGEFKASTQMNS